MSEMNETYQSQPSQMSENQMNEMGAAGDSEAETHEVSSQVAEAAQGKALTEAEKLRNKEFATVKTEFFSLPAQGEAAQVAVERAQNVATKYSLPMGSSFDGQPPTGYDVCVLPLKDKEAGAHKLKAIFIGAIPTLETIKKHEKGAEFIRSAIRAQLKNKMTAAASSLKKGKEPNSVPGSVGDFITSMRQADEGLAAFNALAQGMVQALRKQSEDLIIDTKKLRSVLSSAAYARQEYAGTPQKAWLFVIRKMAEMAESQGFDTSLFETWEKTREETTISSGNLSLEDLENMI